MVREEVPKPQQQYEGQLEYVCSQSPVVKSRLNQIIQVLLIPWSYVVREVSHVNLRIPISIDSVPMSAAAAPLVQG
jgi:hypothetical protein